MNRRPATITHDGVTLTLEGWAGRLGLSLGQMYSRLRRGLPLEEVVAPKIRGRRRPTSAPSIAGTCARCSRAIDRPAGLCAGCRTAGELVEVPLYGREERAVVDANDAPRVLRHAWYLASSGYPCRSVVRAGKKTAETLSAFLVRPARRIRVRSKNGDKLDCRRENLRAECGSASRRHDRTTGRAGTLYQVRITVDRRPYSVGYWPARFVPDVMACLAEAVPELRGRGLEPREIRRALDVAAGRRLVESAVQSEVQP